MLVYACFSANLTNLSLDCWPFSCFFSFCEIEALSITQKSLYWNYVDKWAMLTNLLCVRYIILRQGLKIKQLAPIALQVFTLPAQVVSSIQKGHAILFVCVYGCECMHECVYVFVHMRACVCVCICVSSGHVSMWEYTSAVDFCHVTSCSVFTLLCLRPKAEWKVSCSSFLLCIALYWYSVFCI